MSNPLLYSGAAQQQQQQPAYTAYHHYNPGLQLPGYSPQIPNGYGQEQHHVPGPQPGSAPQYQNASEQLSPLRTLMPTTSVTTSATSAPANSDISAVARTQPQVSPPEANQTSNSDVPVKRKRGRPKGSKTKNKQVNGAAPTATTTAATQTAATKPPTPAPNPVAPAPAKSPAATHQNPVQYQTGSATTQLVPNFMANNSYPGDNLSITTPEEFQWKALSLCSAFYGAAEDLIKATPPGFLEPSWSGNGLTDPMRLLNEARQFCDSLLNVTNRTAATPTSIGTQGQSAMQPQQQALQQQYQLQQQHQSHSAPSPAINNSSLASASLYHPQQVPSNTFTPASSTNILPQPPHQPRTQFPSPTSYTISPTLSFASAPKIQSHWTPDEENRLKDLAERSKEQNPQSGEIDWDYVARWFGEGRSKRQITIKATSMGLKPTQSPPRKRRREDAQAPGPSTSNYTQQQQPGQQAIYTLPL